MPWSRPRPLPDRPAGLAASARTAAGRRRTCRLRWRAGAATGQYRRPLAALRVPTRPACTRPDPTPPAAGRGAHPASSGRAPGRLSPPVPWTPPAPPKLFVGPDPLLCDLPLGHQTLIRRVLLGSAYVHALAGLGIGVGVHDVAVGVPRHDLERRQRRGVLEALVSVGGPTLESRRRQQLLGLARRQPAERRAAGQCDERDDTHENRARVHISLLAVRYLEHSQENEQIGLLLGRERQSEDQ